MTTLDDCIDTADSESVLDIGELEALREELATLRRDAERYRKIRDPRMTDEGTTLNVMAMVLRREHPYTMGLSGDALDNVLDSLPDTK